MAKLLERDDRFACTGCADNQIGRGDLIPQLAPVSGLGIKFLGEQFSSFTIPVQDGHVSRSFIAQIPERFFTHFASSQQEHFLVIESLEQLDLELLQISDKGLAQLQNLKNLKRLNIAMVVVSDEAVADLQAAIRGLDVVRWRIPEGWP